MDSKQALDILAKAGLPATGRSCLKSRRSASVGLILAPGDPRSTDATLDDPTELLVRLLDGLEIGESVTATGKRLACLIRAAEVHADRFGYHAFSIRGGVIVRRSRRI